MPSAAPAAEAASPRTSASASTPRRSWPRSAPTQRSSASIRVRWATSTWNVLAITSAATRSATAANPSTTPVSTDVEPVSSAAFCAARSSTVSGAPIRPPSAPIASATWARSAPGAERDGRLLVGGGAAVLLGQPLLGHCRVEHGGPAGVQEGRRRVEQAADRQGVGDVGRRTVAGRRRRCGSPAPRRRSRRRAGGRGRRAARSGRPRSAGRRRPARRARVARPRRAGSSWFQAVPPGPVSWAHSGLEPWTASTPGTAAIAARSASVSWSDPEGPTTRSARAYWEDTAS